VAADNRAAKVDKPNELQLIQRANAGDKDAASALKSLQDRACKSPKHAAADNTPISLTLKAGTKYPAVERRCQTAANLRQGTHPRWTCGSYADSTDATSANSHSSRCREVRKHLSAWDNAEDKAIFARIMESRLRRRRSCDVARYRSQ
jgi:hypothetical protein